MVALHDVREPLQDRAPATLVLFARAGGGEELVCEDHLGRPAEVPERAPHAQGRVVRHRHAVRPNAARSSSITFRNDGRSWMPATQRARFGHRRVSMPTPTWRRFTNSVAMPMSPIENALPARKAP